MIKSLTLLFFLAFSYNCQSQTFTSSPISLIFNLFVTTDDITVTGIGTIDCDYGLTEVCIDITHTRTADLDIYLIDPNGEVYELTTDNGGSGNDYDVTCFDMTAVTSITAGTAPFDGSYIPEEDLGFVNNNQDADGDWTLFVYDDRIGDVGILHEWSMTFGASPPCPPGPTLEDCGGGITVCSDVTLSGNSGGSGNFLDLNPSNDGCLSGENESSWYYFQAATDGDYEFTIETLVDYDFAVWGPLTEISCPPTVPPSRCSYAAGAGNTGLLMGAGDDTEDEFGDGWVNGISASEDDIFVIVIDNFTADGSLFDLTWTLSGGGSFDCLLLPIELTAFSGEYQNGFNILNWTTESELNCSHYIIDHSVDGVNWVQMSQVSGAGNSSVEQNYQTIDFSPSSGLNYYRLSQVDYDGKRLDYRTITIDNRNERVLVKMINLMGKEVDENYKGVRVCIYNDGTQSKVVSQ